MIKVGNKIKKIRELKNLTTKDMAEKLDITVQGYTKIERDETILNLERLEQISSIFEMRPEELLKFDEKQMFSIDKLSSHDRQSNLGTTQYCLSEKIVQLYEDKIKLLEEKIRWLEKCGLKL